jgi:hypothetical protein
VPALSAIPFFIIQENVVLYGEGSKESNLYTADDRNQLGAGIDAEGWMNFTECLSSDSFKIMPKRKQPGMPCSTAVRSHSGTLWLGSLSTV